MELTENYVKQVEDIIHEVVPPHELQIIVSNIGITTDFSAIYTPNSAPHTAFVQVSLKEGHKVGSYEYMRRVRAQLSQKLPQLSTYFQSGGLVDAVINLGLPAPIDVQVSGNNLNQVYATAAKIAAPARGLNSVSDVLIPQDIDYPALELDVDREKAGLLGLSQKEIVDNVITALTSNGMIAPNYWIDPKSGNPYLLTVQYPEDRSQVHDRSEADSPARRAQHPAYFSGHRREGQNHSVADGSGSLPIVSRRRRLRLAEKSKTWAASPADRTHHQEYEAAGRRPRQPARIGAGHARIVQELWHRPDSFRRARLPGSRRAIRFLGRPLHHSAGRSARDSPECCCFFWPPGPR